MQIQRKEDLAQALILGCFALLLFHLILTGTILLYISSKFIWLSELAAVLLVVMANAKLLPKRHNHKHSCCDHDHACSSGHHSHTNSTNYLRITLFLIPLVLGFAMQPRVLGSTALANSINTAGPVPFYAISSSKNVDNILSASSKVTLNSSSLTANSTESASVYNSADSNKQINKPLQPVDSVVRDTDLVDLAFKIYDYHNQAYDRHWRLTCFVYKDPKLAKNQFVMTRLVVACCIADATPIGIIAETPDALNFEDDTWLEVEGILQKRIIKDADKIQPVSNLEAAEDGTPYFVVTSWKRVSTPKDPYLVPPM